jgi:hypothetical protein
MHYHKRKARSRRISKALGKRRDERDFSISSKISQPGTNARTRDWEMKLFRSKRQAARFEINFNRYCVTNFKLF